MECLHHSESKEANVEFSQKKTEQNNTALFLDDRFTSIIHIAKQKVLYVFIIE